MKQLLTRRSPHERTQQTTTRPPPVRSDTINVAVVAVLGLPVIAVYALILSAAPTLAAIVAAFTAVVTLPIVGPYVVVRVVTRWVE
ncbi:hypothetical protein [Haladaptatus sp. DYF46]|uniref:hypothetical protein n=1 Tax=Haladaptatus sp. DYF46 TaxID=2886041 RepID=UPI001E638D34|nr:hypothetical protein [Haladaptatus sp. DYF46]